MRRKLSYYTSPVNADDIIILIIAGNEKKKRDIDSENFSVLNRQESVKIFSLMSLQTW